MGNRDNQPLLEGMPAPYELRLQEVDDQIVVSFGPNVLYCFSARDQGMHKLAMVSLTQAGVSVNDVSALFGRSPDYVSRLRSKVAKQGSSALVTRIGAPPKLNEVKAARALKMDQEGYLGVEIAQVLGVSCATVSRLLARSRKRALDVLPFPSEKDEINEEASVYDLVGDEVDQDVDEDPATDTPTPASARIKKGEVPSRYAGVMLLYPFLSRLGTNEILATLGTTASRRYDATASVLASVVGFALGSSCLEGTKHLNRISAGATIGLASFPELRTQRRRLGALGDASDPLALQRAFARGMLLGDENPTKLFFCDDHFVAYTGARPVSKGHNTRRGRAEPGREDTFITDASWRAICFSSSEPSGLSKHLPPVVDQLLKITTSTKVMIGFDRGGAYPVVFSALRDKSVDFVTYRRGPLTKPTLAPRRSWTTVDDRRIVCMLVDEEVELNGYGLVRQLSLYEGDKMVLQVLTSNRIASGAALIVMLRRRWCIENAFKYQEDHYGIHWLCSYQMNIASDVTKVANPTRLAARARLTCCENSLEDAERALGVEAATTGPFEEHLARHHRLLDKVTKAQQDVIVAKARLKGIPAKLPANEIDPSAKRAKPRFERRAFQMVCRLLSYNAELDLARRLNTYLRDDNEYRGITRNLMHLGGTVSFSPKTITVTLDRPNPPKLARSLEMLIEELNAEQAQIPGDNRPITYRL